MLYSQKTQSVPITSMRRSDSSLLWGRWDIPYHIVKKPAWFCYAQNANILMSHVQLLVN